MGQGTRPDGFVVTAITPGVLIGVAHDTYTFGRILGTPAWADAERYDVSAKVEGALKDIRVLLQSILRDGFKMRSHTETRPVPAFLLTLARADRQLGPKLHDAAVDCDDGEAIRKVRENKPAGAPLCNGVSGRTRIWMSGMRLGSLANALASLLGRPVIDRTNLVGRFDFDLEYTSTAEIGNGDPADRVSIFTAIQEQLGLRLQADNVPLEVLVIDALERPAEN